MLLNANHHAILTRGIFREAPRRVLLRALSGIGLASLSTVLVANRDADARKRKRKKKCKGGKKKCGKICRDLQVDPLNCGRCGNRCDAGKVCRDGACACPAEETECGDVCCAIGLSCIDDQCSVKAITPRHDSLDTSLHSSLAGVAG